MSLRGWLEKEVTDLRGSWSRLDEVRARPNRAFLSTNVRFGPRGVRTREGFVAGFAVGGKVTSIHDWINSGFSRTLFYEFSTAGVINSRINPGGPSTGLYVLDGRAMTVAEAGDKAFIAVHDNAGMGAGQVRIYQPNVTNTTVDIAFAAPWTTIPVMSDIGVGNVDQGIHYFGYIVETRSGFTGRPSPSLAPGTVHSPILFNVAAGGRSVRMSITRTTPADVAFVHPIMTRVENPNRWYFVPDAQVAVTPGVATTIQITINVSDEALADGAEEANDYFEALAQATAGTGPIHPSSLFTYGKRMAYIVNDKVYFSDPDDYQFITEDQHVVQLPGKRRVVVGCQLRGSAYLFGPQWTAEVSDNGDVPATWPTPTEISSAIGTPAPFGIEWRTAGDYIWVVSRAGLYVFNGQYPLRPISYYNAEWDRINWGAAYAIGIRDDYTNQLVYVAVPLDGATEASHIFCWSYARGLTPEEVDFSLDSIAYFGGGVFGSIGLIRDPATLRSELWVGPANAAVTMIRQAPAAITDVGNIISTRWKSGRVLNGAGRKKINRFGGIDAAITGQTTSVIIESPDDLRFTSAIIEVIFNPGEDPQAKFDIVEEDVCVDYYSTGWFELSSFKIYHKPYATNR